MPCVLAKQHASAGSLLPGPRHTSSPSPDSAAYTSISLPELSAGFPVGSMRAASLFAPLPSMDSTAVLVTPAMPPSVAAR